MVQIYYLIALCLCAFVAKWLQGVPIKWPDWPDPEGVTWDLAFELTTNDPGKVNPADLDDSGWVDFYDFALFAQLWLTDP